MLTTTRKFWVSVIPVILIVLMGCVGPQVDVPPAHFGKISSPDGLQEKLLPPSKFRLDNCPFGQICNNLILAEASDYPRGEEMNIFIPEDQLNLAVGIAGI